MLSSIIGPMILLIVVGVIGMVILCFIASKILKVSFLMATATALTALYGFPPNAIITEATCTALAQTPEEKEFLMSKMFPPMIVGWLHHCDHHLRGNRRHLCRNVLIQSSAKLSGFSRRTALFTKSLLHIPEKPIQ